MRAIGCVTFAALIVATQGSVSAAHTANPGIEVASRVDHGKGQVEQRGDAHKRPNERPKGSGCHLVPGGSCRHAKLGKLDLTGRRLAGIDLTGTVLNKTSLRNADLTGARLVGVTARGADLRGATLNRADLRSTLFIRAKLAGASMRDTRAGIDGSVNLVAKPPLRRQPNQIARPTPTIQLPPSLVPPRPTLPIATAHERPATQCRLVAHGSCRNVDLTGAALRGLNLSKIDLRGARLDRADLRGANLSGARLSGASATRALLSGAKLSKLQAIQADFGKAIVGRSKKPRRAKPSGNSLRMTLNKAAVSGLPTDTLSSAQRQAAAAKVSSYDASSVTAATAKCTAATSKSPLNCESANLSDSDLRGGNFAGADFEKANLSNSLLSDADFSDADLHDANAERTIINGTNFAGANFNYISSGGVRANLSGTPPTLPTGFVLVGGFLAGPSATLLRANLAGLMLGGVDLSSADLEDANLEGANLVGANLEDSVLENAILAAANVMDANFTDANLEDANLNEIISGGVIGEPLNIPTGVALVNGYFLGPQANIYLAEPEVTYVASPTTDSPSKAVDYFYPKIGGKTVTYKRPASFVDADLTGVNASSANLNGVDFEGANLTDADFVDAEMNYANLWDTTITNAQFLGIEKRGIRACQMTGVPTNTATDAPLVNGCFVGPGTDVAGWDVEGLDLSQVNFNYVRSGGVTGTAAAWPPNYGLYGGYVIGPHVILDSGDLAGVDFGSADMTNISAVRADFTGAGLSSVAATHSDFSQSSMNSASLGGTFTTSNFTAVDLNSANIVGDMSSTNLTSANLSYASAGGWNPSAAFGSPPNWSSDGSQSASFANTDLTSSNWSYAAFPPTWTGTIVTTNMVGYPAAPYMKFQNFEPGSDYTTTMYWLPNTPMGQLINFGCTGNPAFPISQFEVLPVNTGLVGGFSQYSTSEPTCTTWAWTTSGAGPSYSYTPIYASGQ